MILIYFLFKGKKIIFHKDSDFIGRMPLYLKKENPKWRCLDYKDKTYVLNNVMLISENGGEPKILRIAKYGDGPKDMIKINLSFVGISNAWYYVPAEPNEIIQHPNLYWLCNGINPPMKIYLPD